MSHSQVLSVAAYENQDLIRAEAASVAHADSDDDVPGDNLVAALDDD